MFALSANFDLPQNGLISELVSKTRDNDNCGPVCTGFSLNKDLHLHVNLGKIGRGKNIFTLWIRIVIHTISCFALIYWHFIKLLTFKYKSSSASSLNGFQLKTVSA